VFNVGGGEILVILVIALLVLGPTRLPGAARQVGKALAEFRRVSGSVERDIRGALDTEELRDSVATFKQVTNLGQTVRSELASAASSLTSPISKTMNSGNPGGPPGIPSNLDLPPAHTGGVTVAPPDGLYADDLPAASSSGAQIPTPNGAFFDVLADRSTASETTSEFLPDSESVPVPDSAPVSEIVGNP
jgi:Tat protein translocase TatB subunit